MIRSTLNRILRGTPDSVLSFTGQMMPESLKYKLKSIKPTETKKFILPKSKEVLEFTFTKNKDWYKDIPEVGLVEELENRLNSESVFYDIGSHFGFHSMVAKAVGVPENLIHTFESDGFIYSILEKNTNNTNINTVNRRVGNRNNSLKIDDYTRYNDDPTIVKIDVEGAEQNVLSAMTETLSRSKPLLYVEVHPNLITEFGYSVNSLIDFLYNFDYELSVVNHNLPLSETEWSPATPSSFQGEPDHILRAE